MHIIRLTESQLRSLIKEAVNEISSQYIQDRLKNTWERNQDGYTWSPDANDYIDVPKDKRIRDMRHFAADKWHEENGKKWGYNTKNYYDNSISHATTRYKDCQIKFIDSDYSSLQELIDGVNAGELLIHCRRMQGSETADTIYPEAGECVQDTYGADYADADTEIPELVFASDDFGWAEGYSQDTRDGIFFVKSDTFQRNLGDGKIQYPNGEIYKYSVDLPLTVEDGDWYSEEPVEVVAIMQNIKKGN